MKTVVFQVDAEAEMIEAAAQYEAQQVILADGFWLRCRIPSTASSLIPGFIPLSNSMSDDVLHGHFLSAFCFETVPARSK
jgi:hypothetical protein